MLTPSVRILHGIAPSIEPQAYLVADQVHACRDAPADDLLQQLFWVYYTLQLACNRE